MIKFENLIWEECNNDEYIYSASENSSMGYDNILLDYENILSKLLCFIKIEGTLELFYNGPLKKLIRIL